MAKLNLAQIVDCTESEGPGRRFAVWVQGCILRCVNCCNQHMQPIVPVKIVTVEDLSARIKLSLNHNNIEGVTLLGGEPMLQAKGLAQFAYECKKMGLTVITFTGYTLESLEGNSIAGATDLISQTDILIDGPFDKEQASNRRNWAGSENQKFHYLTNRYQQGIEFAQAYSPSIEFRITKDGIIETNGWPFEIKNV